MRELTCDPAKIFLEEEYPTISNYKSYNKWNEFKNYMYQLHEMRNEGCRKCEEPPTTCRKCMQDYYWLNM